MTARRLVWGVVLGLIVLAGAALLVVWSVDSFVARAIERYGSEATQVAVQTDSVELSFLDGTAAIDELTVANPDGFSPANAFRLGKIRVVIERGTIRQNPMVIDEITIVEPEVNFELDANGDANVDVIRRNLAAYRGGPEPSADPTPAAEPTPPPVAKEPADTQRFLIRRLSIEGGRLIIAEGVLGGERRVVEMPNTEETDIGARSGGATGADVAAIVASALIRDVAATVAAERVEKALEDSIGGEAGKAVGEGVGEAIKGVGRALNKIFGERNVPPPPPTP